MKYQVFIEILNEGIYQILANKLRSFLTVLGIILGVSSLIVMFSLINSGRERTMGWMQRQINKVTVSYVPPERTGRQDRLRSKEFGISYYDYLVIRAANIKGISQIIPVQQEYANVKTPQNEKETLIIGSVNEYIYDEDFEVDKGRLFIPTDDEYAERVCVIGAYIAQNFFKGKDPLGQQIKVRGSNYTVIGILKEVEMFGRTGRRNRWSEWKNSQIIIPIRTMFTRVSNSKRINLSYRLQDFKLNDSISEQIKYLLINRRGFEDFSLENRMDNIMEYQQTQKMWNIILALIAVISLLVGGIGITNVMLATIKERIREVGIKKSIGATVINIKTQFLLEATILSFSGGIVGVVIGTLFSFSAMRSIQMEASVNFFIIMVGLIFSVIVGILSGIYPAMKAGNVSPIEALRYE